jgi:hypothetical protein
MMKKALVVLTFAVGVSARASAFAPGAAIKNLFVGNDKFQSVKRTPFASKT